MNTSAILAELAAAVVGGLLMYYVVVRSPRSWSASDWGDLVMIIIGAGITFAFAKFLIELSGVFG